MNKHNEYEDGGDLDPLDLFNHILRTPKAQHLSIYEEALKNDRRIEIMSAYQVSRGYTRIPVAVQGCPDHEYIGKISQAFTELKGLVMRGAFTLDELESRVYAQYGIVSDQSKLKAGVISSDKQLAKELEGIGKEEEI